MSFFPNHLPAPKYSFSQVVRWSNHFDSAILFGKIMGCYWDSGSSSWAYQIEVAENSPYSHVYADSFENRLEDDLDVLSSVEIKKLVTVR